jgi:hypothetical protein
MTGRQLLPLLGVLAVAACAGPPPVPPAAMAPAAPEQVDGRYQGIARLVRATINRGCPRSGRRTVTVEGNALSQQYRGERASYALAAVVGPDGSVHGSDGRGNIDGQITGKHMDLDVSSPYCEMRYALDRQ